MNNDKKMRSMLAACGIAAVSVPASAQTDAAAPAPDKVVVTGSRVAITGNDMPTPVTVVTADQLTNTTPSNLADGLNKMPVFNGSSNQGTVENPSTNSVGNFLNLRGIGSARTLILFDGHRLPATASSGAVDVNTLPQLRFNGQFISTLSEFGFLLLLFLAGLEIDFDMLRRQGALAPSPRGCASSGTLNTRAAQILTWPSGQ